MDSWNTDLILSVVQFLTVQDSSRLAATCSRFYYLVHTWRRLRGPELVAATSAWPHTTTRQKEPHEVCQEALHQLQSPPQLALTFTRTSPQATRLVTLLPKYLPNDTIIVNATAHSIQSCIDSHLDHQSYGSVMILNLHEDATIVPFCLNGAADPHDDDEQSTFESVTSRLTEINSNPDYWKVFIVYAAGEGSMEVEGFVSSLQARFPLATIVGGICNAGHISLPVARLLNYHRTRWENEFSSLDLMKLIAQLTGEAANNSSRATIPSKQELLDQVQHLLTIKQYYLHDIPEDGLFGVVLGGTVPVRSVVSRGVKSLMLDDSHRQPNEYDHVHADSSSNNDDNNNNNNSHQTPFFVHQVEFHQPGDDAYIFRIPHSDDDDDDDAASTGPSYHVIRTVQDRATGKLYTPRDLYSRFGRPDVVGLQRPGANGYELLTPHPFSEAVNAFLFFLERNDNHNGNEVAALQDANLDFFDIDGPASLLDMKYKMKLLREQTQNEQVLGAIMYSCSARGPKAGRLINEDMADAKRFAAAFGTSVPCCGFYAGGEIGPLALARMRQDESVFQTGHATLQGFTAVFAVLIVPKIDWSEHVRLLDDAPETVKAYLQKRFAARPTVS